MGGGGDTRSSLIDFDGPTHVRESNGDEATDRASADYDEFFCHGGRVARFCGDGIEKMLPMTRSPVAYLRGPSYGMCIQ